MVMRHNHSEVSLRGYVLAGGASSRFGSDKALVELGGKTALTRVTEVLRQSGVREVVVVGGHACCATMSARCLEDRWPGEGPLGAIVTALLCSLAAEPPPSWNLVVSCDMPFLTAHWLAYMIGRAAGSDADVIVPQSAGGRFEPLCACWRTACAEPLRAVFESGVRKVTGGMQHFRVEVLGEKDWKRFDNQGRLFWNMNTRADYEEAKRILAAGRERQ
jgi:molybdopterin-guanine dinucleotide biosynthesis protein A